MRKVSMISGYGVMFADLLFLGWYGYVAEWHPFWSYLCTFLSGCFLNGGIQYLIKNKNVRVAERSI